MNTHAFHVLVLVAAAMIGHTSADCLWSAEDRSQHGGSVQCTWTAIDAATAAADLQATGAAGAQRLHIACSPAELYESQLPAAGLLTTDAAADIGELHIDDCKLLQLPATAFAALPRLHTLRINTRNAAWAQSTRLQLAAGVLANLTEVHTLDLAENNMRTLSAAAAGVCALTQLQALNVSANRLRSVADLGLAECGEVLANLRTLDVSGNELVSVDAAATWSTALRNVQTLLLQSNNITALAPAQFAALSALRVLNISGNQLETLPEGVFAANRQLQELHLQANRLYQLPANVFAELGELLVLDLSGNQLSSHYVDSAMFAQLRRLVVLRLADNALTRIDAATFAQLSFLQILDLKNNSIGYIDDDTFEPLVNLHTLQLAGNRLHIVNNALFNGLFTLSRLVLSNNLITVVESAAFRNCSALRELDLSSNQLADVPVAVQELSMLRSLDLGENRIVALPNGTFRGLQQLTGLRLMDNLIVNVTRGVFYDLPKLNVLNLARNRIQTIERYAFDGNVEVEAIRLDRNQLSDANGVFATVNSLQWLNLSENQLVWFDYAFVPKNLRWLDIHGNYIEQLGNYYEIQAGLAITTLDASHNRIAELSAFAVPNSVELFFVNNNLIRNIYPNTFVDKRNLTRVDLYANYLTKVSVHAMRIQPLRQQTTATATTETASRLPDFYLAGNPLECDCSMSWLRQQTTGKDAAAAPGTAASPHLPNIADWEQIECLVSHQRSEPVRSLRTLQHGDFLCRFESQCPASCHCCEMKQCHCQVKCPDGCSCFADAAGAQMQVNCGKQNALALPERLPMDAAQLYLDGNNYLEVRSYAFASLRRVRSLYLNGSNVIQLQAHALTGLSGLHRLHLNDNKLTVLYGPEFAQLWTVRELYLQDNMLTHIANTTFAGMRHLRVLRLDGNRLSSLSAVHMQSAQFRGLHELRLADNQWSCGCEFLQDFIPLVFDNDVAVPDAGRLMCGEEQRRQPILANMSMETCASSGMATAIDTNVVLAASAASAAAGGVADGIPHGYVPLLGFACTLVLVLAVLVAVFTVKEQLCCVRRMRGSAAADAAAADAEKQYGYGYGQHRVQRPLYDVLIVNAADDVEAVSAQLVAPLLHARPTVAIGVQHRNVTGAQLGAAAARSRKIVVHLTDAFLAGEWTRPDVRRAISNSWIPGRIVLVQTPHVQFHSNRDRELLNNIGAGIVLLQTWQPDFGRQLRDQLLAVAEPTPAHYADTTLSAVLRPPPPSDYYASMSSANGGSGAYDPSEKIWKSAGSRHVHHPYAYVVDAYADAGGDQRNDSYYSSATAESVLPAASASCASPTMTVATHVYAGIDSDYGSVTNEDSSVACSVHKPLMATAPASATTTTTTAAVEPTSPVCSTTSSADTEVTSMMSASATGDHRPLNGAGFFV